MVDSRRDSAERAEVRQLRASTGVGDLLSLPDKSRDGMDRDRWISCSKAVIREETVCLGMCSEPSWLEPSSPLDSARLLRSKCEARSLTLDDETEPRERPARLIWCMSRYSKENCKPAFLERGQGLLQLLLYSCRLMVLPDLLPSSGLERMSRFSMLPPAWSGSPLLESIRDPETQRFSQLWAFSEASSTLFCSCRRALGAESLGLNLEGRISEMQAFAADRGFLCLHTGPKTLLVLTVRLWTEDEEIM